MKINYALYNTVTRTVLKWGDPSTGDSLLTAYTAALEYCKSKEDPEKMFTILEIFEMQNSQPVQSFSIQGAYEKLKDAQNNIVVEDEPAPVIVEEEEEIVPDDLIPSSSMGPWYVDTVNTIDHAIPIRDHDKVLVAMVVDNDQTKENLEQNARLICKAPELMLLASRILSSIHDKDDGIRTEDEQRFLDGMYLLFGGHEIRTEIDILDQNSRDILLSYTQQSNDLYRELYGWIQHGKAPTEEMKQGMYAVLEKTIEYQSIVQTHLL